MKTTQIEIPEGMEIDEVNKDTGTVTFRKKRKVTDHIKSLADAIEELGDNHLEVVLYRKLQDAVGPEHPTHQQAMVVIAAALNEGWTPDWSNSDEYKYFPWFEMRGSAGFRFVGRYDYWHSHSAVGSRLCFKSSELALYAGKTFEKTYEKFMTI